MQGRQRRALGLPQQLPAWQVELDTTHPLAQGLIAYWAFGTQGGLADFCGNAGALTPSSAATTTPTLYGSAWAGSANDQYLKSAPVPSPFKRTDAASLFWLGMNDAESTSFGGPMFAVTYDNAAGAPFQGYAINGDGPSQGSGARVGIYSNNGSSSTQIYIAPNIFGRQSLVGSFIFGGGTASLYRNGALLGSGTASGTPAYTATSLVTINGYPVVASRTMNKRNVAAAIWSRALTAQEAQWLDAEPFAMLRPVRRRALYLATGNVTVTPGTGTLVFAGQQPSFSASSDNAPGVGALTFTGQQPAFSAGSDNAPGVGLLSFSGQQPTFSASSINTPGAGTLSFTGFSPSVSASAVLTPGAGTLVFTGYAPTYGVPSVSVTVTPGVGTLTFTGFAPSTTATEFRLWTQQAVPPGQAWTPGDAVQQGDLLLNGYDITINGTPLTMNDPRWARGDVVPPGQ